MSECTLCEAYKELIQFKVEPRDDTIEICDSCLSAMDEPTKHEKHWNCLHNTMWSTDPATQVVIYRIFSQLNSQDQLDMMFLEDETKTWALETLENEVSLPVLDSNGTLLTAGDSVSIIKDLPVKGAGFTAKQGTTVKGIRMVPDDPTHIQGKVNGSMIYIISAFVKKL